MTENTQRARSNSSRRVTKTHSDVTLPKFHNLSTEKTQFNKNHNEVTTPIVQEIESPAIRKTGALTSRSSERLSHISPRKFQTPSHRKSDSIENRNETRPVNLSEVTKPSSRDNSKSTPRNLEHLKPISILAQKQSPKKFSIKPLNPQQIRENQKTFESYMYQITGESPLRKKILHTMRGDFTEYTALKATESERQSTGRLSSKALTPNLKFRSATDGSPESTKKSDTGIEVPALDIDPKVTAEILQELSTFKTKYQFNKSDSKFDEITGLRKKNTDLQLKNALLKKDIAHLDEFRLALDKHVEIDNFHEKRVDVLKAQVTKQKRYIDYLTKALKITKLFYKDQMAILNYLIDIDKKIHSDRVVQTKTQTSVEDTARVEAGQAKAINDIVQYNSTSEEFQKFLRNFNDAYDKVRASREKEEETKRMFNVTLQILKAKDMLSHRITPALRKKVRYNVLLHAFIEKYKNFFPIFTIFDDFDFVDKKNFSDFLKCLVKQSEKIEEVFNKIKFFDILKHNPFPANKDVARHLTDNVAAFDEYFNKKNQAKRILLNSEKIFDTEKSLSKLLGSLLLFQNQILVDKSKVSVELVVELQNQVNENIEKLLSLGIATDVNPVNGGSIIVVNEHKRAGTKIGELATRDQLERISAEMYSWREASFREFENYRDGSHFHIMELKKKLSDFIAKDAKGKEVDEILRKLRSHVDHLLQQHDEIHAYQKVLKLTNDYQKEFLRTLSNDAANAEGVMDKKNELINTILSKVNGEMRQLQDNFDHVFERGGEDDLKIRAKFVTQFKKVFGEVFDYLFRALNGKEHPIREEIGRLDKMFKEQCEKVKQDLQFFSNRNSKIAVTVIN